MYRIILTILAMLCIASCEPVFAADCQKALFGWDTKSGQHINGVFGNEGGYQNLPGDSGNFRHGKNCGGTKYGITCRDHPGVDIKHLTKDQAAEIYSKNEWKAIRGDDLKSQYLAYKALDLAINNGAGTAAILLEKTINDLNGLSPDFPLTGVLTPGMVTWLNDFTAVQNQRWWFFDHLKLQALKRYISISQKNSKLRQFFLTWSARDVNDE